jgi:hypothetical protein
MKIAYPTMLCDRNIMNGQAMMCSVLTLSITNNQNMDDIEYGNIYDIYLPPAYLHLFEAPPCNILDLWRVLGRSLSLNSSRLPAFFENLRLQRHVTAGGGAFGHKDGPKQGATFDWRRKQQRRLSSTAMRIFSRTMRSSSGTASTFSSTTRESPELAMTISRRLLAPPRSLHLLTQGSGHSL